MAAKFVIAVFAQVIVAQCVMSQVIRNPIGPTGIPAPYGPGCGCAAPSSSGGGFPVTSVSPIAPTGISIFSENAIEGPLVVGGNLPFLGTVALEGVLPTAGAGAVSYGCGNGAIGIVSEAPIATGIVGPAPYAGQAPYAPGLAPYGAGILGAPAYNGIGGIGCGCGAIY